MNEKLSKEMVEKIKKIVRELAFSAVQEAEKKLKTESGQKKKEMAIKFLLDKLPVQFKPFKAIIQKTLSQFIDKTIEEAVAKLKENPNATKVLAG